MLDRLKTNTWYQLVSYKPDSYAKFTEITNKTTEINDLIKNMDFLFFIFYSFLFLMKLSSLDNKLSNIKKHVEKF